VWDRARAGVEGRFDPSSTHAISVMALFAFLRRRQRAAADAEQAYRAEQRFLGDEYRPDTVTTRESLMAECAEMAALLAKWAASLNERAALLTAASALRSAFFLWLEDDDRSMAATRTVLECVARLRAHRVKPQRAMRVEAAGSSATPRDWFEAAGWRRLNLLTKSLGELSHFRMEARWGGARDALVAIASRELAPEHPPELRARGLLVETSGFLLASEVIERLRLLSPELSKAYESLLEKVSGHKPGSNLEGWLGELWNMRDFDLGPPSFGGPAVVQPFENSA
jgi:hypothetical protein